MTERRTLAEILAPLSDEENKANPMEMWIRIGEMADRLRAVSELHHEDGGSCAHCTGVARGNLMDCDYVAWPCATAIALNGETK